AAASDAGNLAVALFASERAERIFESLGRGAQTARALLARASVLAALGASQELTSLARRGITLARQARDTTCEGYFWLCLCDGAGDDTVRRVAAQRASEIFENGTSADRLRCAARTLL